MSEMPFEEEHMDVLQNIEASIHAVHLQNPELTDYEVDSALEALQRTYQRESIGKPAILPRNPRSAEVYEAARAACEIRLGRAPLSKSSEEAGAIEIPPVPLEIILKALKRIRKSVDYWTKQSGRQGYLDYISQFIL